MSSTSRRPRLARQEQTLRRLARRLSASEQALFLGVAAVLAEHGTARVRELCTVIRRAVPAKEA